MSQYLLFAFCIGVVFLTCGFYDISGTQEDWCSQTSLIRVVLMQWSSQTLHFDLKTAMVFSKNL